MHRLSVFITVPQYRALQALVKQRGCTLAELIRRAIEQFLKTDKE